MLGSDSGIISRCSLCPRSQHPSQNASNMHITSVATKKQIRTPNSSAIDFFECVLPTFAPLQLTWTDPKTPRSRILETSRRSHSFEHKKSNKCIEHGAKGALGASSLGNSAFPRPMWRISASRPACSRIWIFFVRSQHTESSNPAKMRRTTLETRVSTPASAHSSWPSRPGLRFFLSDGWTDVFFMPRLKVKWAICCCTHIQSTQLCDATITWTAGECLRRFSPCVCVHFACLVTFFWMPS